jgi:hypothetical protein
MRLIQLLFILGSISFLANCSQPIEGEDWTIRDATVNYVSKRPPPSGVLATHVEVGLLYESMKLRRVYLPYFGITQPIPKVGDRCTTFGKWRYLGGIVGSGRRINHKKLYRVAGKMVCGDVIYTFESYGGGFKH